MEKVKAGVAQNKELHLFSLFLAGMPGDESDRFKLYSQLGAQLRTCAGNRTTGG